MFLRKPVNTTKVPGKGSVLDYRRRVLVNGQNGVTDLSGSHLDYLPGKIIIYQVDAYICILVFVFMIFPLLYIYFFSAWVCCNYIRSSLPLVQRSCHNRSFNC